MPWEKRNLTTKFWLTFLCKIEKVPKDICKTSWKLDWVLQTDGQPYIQNQSPYFPPVLAVEDFLKKNYALKLHVESSAYFRWHEHVVLTYTPSHKVQITDLFFIFSMNTAMKNLKLSQNFQLILS